VVPQEWPEQGGSRWHEDAGAAAEYEQLFVPGFAHAQHLVEAKGAQHAGAAAWERSPSRQRAGAAAQEAGPSRQLGKPKDGPPWWHRLDDFVPVAALRHGRDPR
jgi:hypothetical protein